MQLPNGSATERNWYAMELDTGAGAPFLSMTSLPTVSIALLFRSAVMVFVASGDADIAMPDREFEETCEKLTTLAPHLVPLP